MASSYILRFLCFSFIFFKGQREDTNPGPFAPRGFLSIICNAQGGVWGLGSMGEELLLVECLIVQAASYFLYVILSNANNIQTAINDSEIQKG